MFVKLAESVMYVTKLVVPESIVCNPQQVV